MSRRSRLRQLPLRLGPAECRSAKATTPPYRPQLAIPRTASHINQHHLQINMSGRPSFSQLAQKFVQQRASAAGRASGGRSSGPNGGAGGQGGPSFGQALGGVGGTVLLVGGGLLVNSALFNGE